MMLEEQPFASSRPTTSSSHLSDQDPPMSYAAAVESLSVSRLRVKVVLSPRLKRSGNQPPIKRPSPKNSPDTKVKLIPPTQSKPHNVLNPKRNMAQVPPQSRVAQANPKPNNSLPPAGNNKKSKSKKSQKARQNQQRAEATSPELPVSPQPCDVTPQSCSPKFSDTTAYLDHYHEQMQRILAEQTAGQKPYPNRGQVKSCKHNAQLPTNRSLFDFDERLFKRGDLESAAILAQNQAMMRKWLNPSMLIS
ncbi:uncharacterized protein LOC6543934 isoform X2 [Drosophila erecta]|nr:uncharacterized protein LOC6543934 isoform X2 [Drosophila erecta]KQS44090.1 uncharacterized protein Dere_GG13571, isoform B [Drosophila erecta]